MIIIGRYAGSRPFDRQNGAHVSFTIGIVKITWAPFSRLSLLLAIMGRKDKCKGAKTRGGVSKRYCRRIVIRATKTK